MIKQCCWCQRDFESNGRTKVCSIGCERQMKRDYYSSGRAPRYTEEPECSELKECDEAIYRVTSCSICERRFRIAVRSGRLFCSGECWKEHERRYQRERYQSKLKHDPKRRERNAEKSRDFYARMKAAKQIVEQMQKGIMP